MAGAENDGRAPTEQLLVEILRDLKTGNLLVRTPGISLDNMEATLDQAARLIARKLIAQEVLNLLKADAARIVTARGLRPGMG